MVKNKLANVTKKADLKENMWVKLKTCFAIYFVWPLSLQVGPLNTLSNPPKSWVRQILFFAMPGFWKCLVKPPFPIKVKQSWLYFICFRTSLFLLDDPKNFTKDELGPFFILLFTHLHFIYLSLCNTLFGSLWFIFLHEAQVYIFHDLRSYLFILVIYEKTSYNVHCSFTH